MALELDEDMLLALPVGVCSPFSPRGQTPALSNRGHARFPEPTGLPASGHLPSGSTQDASPARAIQSWQEVRGQRGLQGWPGN